MIDEATRMRWAIHGMLDAIRHATDDCPSLALSDLDKAKRWLERVIEEKAKREEAEEAARVLAAYTDLADAA